MAPAVSREFLAYFAARCAAAKVTNIVRDKIPLMRKDLLIIRAHPSTLKKVCTDNVTGGLGASIIDRGRAVLQDVMIGQYLLEAPLHIIALFRSTQEQRRKQQKNSEELDTSWTAAKKTVWEKYSPPPPGFHGKMLEAASKMKKVLRTVQSCATKEELLEMKSMLGAMSAELSEMREELRRRGGGGGGGSGSGSDSDSSSGSGSDGWSD